MLFYRRGEGATVQRWLSALADDLVRSRPRLLLAQVALAADGGRVEEAARLLDAAERRSAGAADEPFEPSASRAASLLVNIPAGIALFRARLAALRGDAGGTAASASRAMTEIREGEQMLDTISRWYLGMAQWLHGLLPAAERTLSSSIAQLRAQGLIATRLCHVLGQVQRAQGRLDAAIWTCQQALEMTAAPGRSAPPAAGAAHVGLAEVAYQRNELDTALRHAVEGIRLCRQLAYTPPLAAGLATLAWIRQATSDPAGALDAIGEAERVSPRPAVTGLLNPVPAQRARLLLAQGDLAAAARWIKDRDLGDDDEPDYPREPEHLVLARVLLAQGQPGKALALLDRLNAAAAAQDRAGSLIEIGALRALALAAGGEEKAAVDALAGALTTACPQGYVRVFADEGPSMAALLGRLIAAQRTGRAAAKVPLGCLARLQRAFDAGPPVPGPGHDTAVPGIIDPLTSRELEVLQMLAAGMPNQGIAGQLVVSLDTVKKHVSHVLGKLGAANRTEAVARARELSLIP